MEFAYDGGGLAKGGDVTLYYDGTAVGTGRVDREPVETGDELVKATGHPLQSAKLLWNRLQGLLIYGFGETTERTLQSTGDYRRFIDSTPSWAVNEALARVYDGHN